MAGIYWTENKNSWEEALNVVEPNGFIAHLYGPITGRRHDYGKLRKSLLLEQLKHRITLMMA